jgi:hypothetical protein
VSEGRVFKGKKHTRPWADDTPLAGSDESGREEHVRVLCTGSPGGYRARAGEPFLTSLLGWPMVLPIPTRPLRGPAAEVEGGRAVRGLRAGELRRRVVQNFALAPTEHDAPFWVAFWSKTNSLFFIFLI